MDLRLLKLNRRGTISPIHFLIFDMLTVGEIENTRKLLKAAEIYKEAVNKSIRLEAMKAENRMREIRGESPAYSEEHFLELLEDD